jgi:UDP-N-acetylmuramate dehydrogenase
LSEAEAQRLRAKAPEAPLRPIAPGQYKVPAAWLIEKAGLKGLQIGKARISPQHALVLENTGGASPQEIARLAEHVQKVVAQTWNIHLIPEVRYLTP